MTLTILCDFDGTITNIDVIDSILHEIIGKAETDILNYRISTNVIDVHTYLDKLTNITETELVNLLNIAMQKNNIKIDPTFFTFVNWCRENSIKLCILSHGIKTIIKYFIKTLDDDNILSHDLVNGRIIYNENIIPKCKYGEKINCKIIHIGDGNSDFSMINHCDVLFAKKNSSLERKCIDEKISYQTFSNFNDIMETLLLVEDLKLDKSLL